MQMIRETHTDWDEDQVLERAFSLMNLQPNTNQAEKIPKSVLSIISQIVKLNENNWAIWEPMFMDCIRPIKNAKRILTEEIPSGHTDYDEELDSHLLGLILSSCDHGPTSRINTYTVREQGEEEQLGSTLYKRLKAALTINDEVKLSAIHDRVHEVKLAQRNIVNLGKELDQIWNDAARLSSRMDEKLKKSTLYRCVKDDWLYTQTVDSLKAAQPGCSYEYAYHALAKKHQEAKLSGRIRATARVASNRSPAGQAGEHRQVLNQEGYNRGRRDPAYPNEPAKCYKCRQPGHIAINCTNTTHHMVRDEGKLIAPTPKQGSVDTAGHKWLRVQAIDVKIPLTDVLHVPNLSKNLLSIPALTENGARVIFEESGATILQHDGSMVKSKTNRSKKRWEVYGDSLAAQLNDPLEGIDATTTPAKPASHTTSKLWHERFGHPGRNKTKQIPGIMVGYDDEHKGWKFFTPGHTPSIWWSNSATFHEAKGWHDRPSVRNQLQLGFESLEAEGTRPEADSNEPELEVEVLDMEDPLPKIHTAPPADPTDDNRSELDVEEMIGEAHSATLNLTPTLKEALASDDAQQWQEAICKELDGLEAMGTWEIVDVPPNTRLVNSKIVLQLKLDADGIPVRHKARLVARGFTQREGIDFEETFTPVAPLSAIRALLSLAVERNWEVHQLDITMAYLNSTLNHVIYMKPPEGAKVPKGKAYRVIKGLYGLKQSGWEWNMEFDKFLQRSNFHRLDCAPCIYTRGEGDNFAIVVIYVDDTLIIAPTLETVRRIKEEIGQRWRMEDGGNVSHFLGIKITRNREAKTMDLEQTSYVKQLLDEHLDKRRRKSSVPLQDIPVPETAASMAERKEYPQIVGKLLWLSNGTCPDISQAVGVLARYMTQPSREHYNAAQKVLQYLDHTRDIHLQYGSDKQQDFLMAHSDANWASDATAQRKSSSGSAVFVCGNLVAWKSALQCCTALSAVEAEFVAATEAAREVLFFKHLFKTVGIDVGIPTIFSDNTGTIQVSKDPAQHWKLKHIDTKYHFIRDNVQDGKVKIKYINTADNLADLFTKPVGKTTLQRARQGLGLKTQHDAVDRQSPALPLREAVEGDETKQGPRPEQGSRPG
ncbi:uncharacterized protein UDID_17467 [Ustilago sp. UG-2017a]|nr:uncharacterized protein UDID_17467 [Ustilago sp. UG-2017a]